MEDPKSENASERAAKTATQVLVLVQQLSTELHPHRVAQPAPNLDSSLDRDLGIDSLGRMELLSRMERAFDVALPERAFAEAETARDLLRSLRAAAARQPGLKTSEMAELALGDTKALPYTARTLVDVMNWHARVNPTRMHIQVLDEHGEGDRVTYEELQQQAIRIAAGLQQRGVAPGATVAIMLPTGRDYFFSFMGILRAGCIPVPIYPPARPTQLEDHLRRHRALLSNALAEVLITVSDVQRLGRLLRTQVDSLTAVVTVAELAATTSGAPTDPVRTAEDIAFLQYTSGSTGDPKGVVLTHANLLANIRAMGHAASVGSDDVLVSWLPLYHDMGLIGFWMGSLYYAAPLVVMSPLSFLARPHRWLQAIHRYRGTLSAAPNFGYELCLRNIEERDVSGLDLSCWRAAFNGAEPVSPETIERFQARFQPYGLRPEAMTPVYGMAECSVGLAFTALGRGPRIDRIQRAPFLQSGLALPAEATDTNPLRMVCCGQPLTNHEIRIVDGAGRELPERREGRLQFRGPSATSGYFRNPEASQRLFQDDWLDSGDRGYMAGGEVFISGRSKDIIIRAGRNLYPQELEDAVGNLAAVRNGRVAVFGATDKSSGTERLVVLAETRERQPASQQKLRAQINALTTDLTGTPADDVVLAHPGTVLKTSSGKIRRSASRALYERGELGKRQRAIWLQLAMVLLTSFRPALRQGARAALSWCYSVYAWTTAAIVALGAGLLVAVLPGRERRRATAAAAVRFLARLCAVAISVSGMENLPRAGRCVLVSNHTSYLDSLALIATLPLEFGFVAKAELTRHASLRFLLRRLGTEFVERFDKAKGIDDARHLSRLVGTGRALLFFPEGMLSRRVGLLPFQMGAFLAAAEASVPVVPVTIRGTRSILRADSWFPRHGRICLTISPPIETLAADTGSDMWARAVALRDTSRKEILRHCGEPDLAEEALRPEKAP